MFDNISIIANFDTKLIGCGNTVEGKKITYLHTYLLAELKMGTSFVTELS